LELIIIANLINLSKDQIKDAGLVAGRAFQDDPVTILSFPDENERKEKLRYGFEMIYKYGLHKGKAMATSENLEGIAIWMPPKEVHQTAWSMIRHGGFRAMRKSGLISQFKSMMRSIDVFNYMTPVHKRLAPFDHWYLLSIAVDPEEQGKGYGSLLLREMFKIIDNEKLPIYLETNTEKNVGFYQRHGFEVLEYAIIPKTDIPIWCMLRKIS